MARPFLENKTVLRRRGIRWLVIFGAWTMVGLFMTSQDYLRHARNDRPVDVFKLLFLMELPFAYLWALLTPVLLAFARRFRIERGRLLRNSLIHVSASLLLSVVTMAGISTVSNYLFVEPAARRFSLAGLLFSIYTYFDYYILIYWLILMISHAFDYYSRYREGELRASQLQAQLAQAELQALKMQLHPHFLFNTLHSISALQLKDIGAANRMIARLGDFLRLTLDNSGAQEVSLQKELEFLKCYLEIERIRFQDRLTVNMEVEPQTLDARVPNLILQPIVENAIKHGISPRAAPGRIDIRARRENGLLRVQVEDNGRGIGANGGGATIIKEGLGLSNTRARLEQLYGAGYRFDIHNVTEGGLRVTLEIPLKAEGATGPRSNGGRG
ncbi:MAG TPA: histidine kinase [Blastocatellia bacterium]|jgi:sensor histidine kinase YesM|nr:histidine kinase [Blastocatellia bacterium]